MSSTTNGSSATIKQPRKRAARKVAAVAQPQPQPPTQELIDLAARIAAEEIEKAARVYVDVPGIGHPPTPEGTLAAVQREQRSDGTLGEYLLCEIRKAKQKGQPDSVQRYSLARLQALITALESAGVKLFQ